MDFESILVFCDGACSGNPGPGGWGAVIITPTGHVKELGGGDRSTTNNAMEMMALSSALSFLRDESAPILFLLDSVYVLKGITEWVYGWRRRGWKTAEGKDVANRDLWEVLARRAAHFEKGQLRWGYVPGHAGVSGNEAADRIAVAFSKGERVFLFDGPESQYGSDLRLYPEDISIPELKYKNNGEKKAPYCYLSYVDGKLERHATWAECEVRVKGRPGARFKKAMSPEEEQTILQSWGLGKKG